jgi:hypothetical protein
LVELSDDPTEMMDDMEEILYDRHIDNLPHRHNIKWQTEFFHDIKDVIIEELME